ncbi:MAG: hypothetical protein HGA97_00840 [Chlorobiaceae bacterium]|nr:hypothetical protein [Chlorobiaceae bacterium]
MEKIIAQGEFVRDLIRKSGAATDEDFGKLFGVTKSSVSQWKHEKSPLPLEKFLSIFGPDTLDWIKGQYNLQDTSDDKCLAEFGRRVADAIHYGIETGIISVSPRNRNGFVIPQQRQVSGLASTT